MINRFQQYIAGQNLCGKSDRILLGVSGGTDSMVMLDLFVQAGYNVAVAHCNFRLRGAEADEDEQFVIESGKKYGVEVFVRQFNTSEYAASEKVSIQVAARNLRYAWFEELRKEKNLDLIAVAHHVDDQIETFFINLLRGGGLAGMKGMPVKRDHIIRPLLFASREEIEEYARDRKLQCREDSSNKEDKYLRNKIRHKLVPVLQDLSDNYRDRIIKSMSNLRDADRVLQRLTGQEFEKLVERKGNTLTLKLNELRHRQSPSTWFYYFLHTYGFNRSVTDNITEAVMLRHSGKMFYSDTHVAVVHRDELLIKPVTVEAEEESIYMAEAGQTEINVPVRLQFQTIAYNKDFVLNKDPLVAQLDEDKLSFPLKIRKWRKGDRMKMLGMSGSKLLSDYFIDNKLSVFDKNDTWLLLSGDDIVWIIGHRISDEYKITPETRSVFVAKMIRPA